MRKHAVIFMLIMCLLAGCAGRGDSSHTPSSQGAPSSEEGSGESNGASTSPSSGAPSGEATGKAPDTSGQLAGESGVNDSQTPAHALQEIPASNESAVSDWGTADSPSSGFSARTDAGKAAGDGGSKGSANDPGASTASTFSQVLVDREDLYFAIRNVKEDSVLGCCWQVYVENRTAKNLMFSFEKVAVNGVMCDPYWAEVIAAGKKGNCEIIWLRDSLTQRQITDIRKVEFTLNIYNDDDYTEAPLMHDPFTVYPSGQDTPSFTPDRRTPAASDHVLVDNDNCTVTVTGFDPGNSWGYVMHLYIVNKTDQDLVFSAQNTSLNDTTCDTYWAEIVTAGNAAYSAVLWDKGLLAENAITEVREIAFPLFVFSDQSIAEPLVDETFRLTP